MPLLILYIIKLSISLAVMYLFYQVLLRRLTFYKWNRWYLLGYSVACFFIPLINVAGMLDQNGASQYKVVSWIPAVASFTTGRAPLLAAESNTSQPNWNWLIVIIATVSLCMVVRLLVQYFSFWRIRQNAQLVADGDVALYYMALPAAPFSFGNAIFINPQQYSEAEMNEIIYHEWVHVQQRHSADAVWSEILCILNWYNPFAWLIRKAIRQNLEFIADDCVLQRGMDKKAYQYLLLHTASHRQFAVANSFNFSSLKKRIAMMNKLKTAPVHLLKFMFVLPLITVLIFACRQEQLTKEQNHQQNFWFSGLTIDAATQAPLKGVTVLDKLSGNKAVSDERGFFKMQVPGKTKPINIAAQFFVPGQESRIGDVISVNTNDRTDDKNSATAFAYLMQNGNAADGFILMRYDNGEPTFQSVHAAYTAQKEIDEHADKVDAVVGNSKKPIWIIDGIPHAVGKGAKGWFDKEEVEALPQFQVWVDGKIMTMEEANRTVDRFTVRGVGAYPKEYAMKRYGVNTNLLLLSTREINGDWTDPKHYTSQ